MEEALSCSHTGLSTNFDIDREIDLSSQSRALHIDNTYRVGFLFVLQVIDYADQIFSFA